MRAAPLFIAATMLLVSTRSDADRRATISGTARAPTTASAISSKPLAPTISSKPLAPTISSKPLAPTISSKPLAPTISSTRRASTTIPAAAHATFAPLTVAGWHATWDADTGVPIFVTGSYIDAPGAARDPAIAERVARAELARHLELLAPGARVADFALAGNHFDGELRTVAFAQSWHGIPVHDAAIWFVFGHDRLFAMSSSAWPHVNAIEWRSARPREVLPIDGRFEVVEVVRAGDDTLYVDRAGATIARTSDARSAAATLKYNVGKRYATGERIDAAASTAAIVVNGIATTTNTSGAFAWSGTSAATVVPSLDGTYLSVHNYGAANATASLTAQPGLSVVWDLATDEVGDAQLSAYVYVSVAKARARIINPSIATWFDTALPVYVNEPAMCNAIGNKTDLHFQRAGGGCENTARVADIAYHEFGHTFHFNSVIMNVGLAEPSLSEGLADFFAANITEDSGVGRGIYFNDTPLRDIDPLGIELSYPLNYNADDWHASGRIISGALWDLRKSLMHELGVSAGIARAERIFTGLMQRARDIPTTSFNTALIADDDDGNLGNGTPNDCLIERAFGEHGLVPGYVGTRVHEPVITDLEIALTVDTPAPGRCAPLGVVAMHVTWRPGDGVASTFDLVPDGATWKGTFPPQRDYTTVSYSVDVIFDDGSVQTFPNNPADPLYQLFVGKTVPILCDSFAEAPQWEQTSNLGFEWNWGEPAANDVGDPPVARTGAGVIGTNVNLAYRPTVVSSIAAPTVDVSKYERVHLQYWRWLTVENAQYDQAQILANDTEAWRNAAPPATELDHIDREWRFHDLDITPFVVDAQVQVRWTLTTDNTKQLGGWSLDDVCIVGIDKIRACGDGELDLGEQCDDGNTRIGDGCDGICKYEITAGGGGLCQTGGGGNIWLVLLSGAIALRAGGRRDPSRCASRNKPAGRAGRRGSSA